MHLFEEQTNSVRTWELPQVSKLFWKFGEFSLSYVMATKKWKQENGEKLKKYRRDYYYRNKDSHYVRNKKTQDKIQKFVLEQKQPCIICGEEEKACIDFHHLRDKEMNVSQMYLFGSIKKVEEEIKKCVCLCANCHRKLHAGLIQLNTGVV